MKRERDLLRGVVFYVLAMSASSLFSVTFAATTTHVPSDYATIQAGIDAASDGDTVSVADGVYTGEGNKNIDFKGKKITVQSEGGPEACIIDCRGNGRGFVFVSGETRDAVLAGLTITNGKVFEGTAAPCPGCGGGIYMSGASPTIRNCVISENLIFREDGSVPQGGGIYCDIRGDSGLCG